MDETPDEVTVSGAAFRIRFDQHTGTLASLSYGGKEMLAQQPGTTTGPLLNVFRAFTDNDGWFRADFYGSGLSQMAHRLQALRVDRLAPHAVQVRTALDCRGFKGNGFAYVAVYTILGDGTVVVDNQIDPVGTLPPLPKLGVRLTVPGAFENFTWLGRGPGENYPDRKTSADIGLYHSTVREQFVEYVRPQEHGNKEDVRWAALTDDAGTGLLFVADGHLAVTVSHFTAEDLDGARHKQGEPKRFQRLVPRESVVVCLDHQQMGLGGASCGPPPMAKYLCAAAPVAFRYTIRPYAPASGPLERVARERIPVCGPVQIERDEQGLVQIQCRTPEIRIRYTLDGNEPTEASPEYTAPVPHADAVVVRARAFGAGLLPGPAATAAFEKIVPVVRLDRAGWKVLHVDSEEPEEGPAPNAIDGDPATYWHTRWRTQEDAHPHEICLDLGVTHALVGFEYRPRQNQANGRIARYEFHVSADGESWGPPIAQGTFPDSPEAQRVLFAEVRAQYVRLRALSEVHGQPWASMAELNLFGPVVPASGPR